VTVLSSTSPAEVKLLRHGDEVLNQPEVQAFDRRNLLIGPQVVLDFRGLRDETAGRGITDARAHHLSRREAPTLRPWADLAERGVPWADGLNFNGIVLTSDREHVVACQTNLGRFWQVSLATGQVNEVAGRRER